MKRAKNYCNNLNKITKKESLLKSYKKWVCKQ